MKFNTNFDLVELADEYMAVPIGNLAATFHGVITLSEPAAYLLKRMKDNTSIDDMVSFLLEEYEVDDSTAVKDVQQITQKFRDLGLVIDD